MSYTTFGSGAILPDALPALWLNIIVLQALEGQRNTGITVILDRYNSIEKRWMAETLFGSTEAPIPIATVHPGGKTKRLYFSLADPLKDHTCGPFTALKVCTAELQFDMTLETLVPRLKQQLAGQLGPLAV